MMKPSRSDELEVFKTEIDIRDVMASRGYVLDPRKSSRVYSVMRHANGEKLIVTRKSNRHWIFASAHDASDRGTVIDFLGKRERMSLGSIRKALRPWASGGLVQPVSQQQFAELIPSRHDGAKVSQTWERARPIDGPHPYLVTDRRIPTAVLADPIFAGRLRGDHRGNALFAHFNAEGLCGFEIKNRSFTAYATGGMKGLGCSRPRPDDQTLVLCETWIDLLSLAALEGTRGRRFLSVAGQISPAQESLLVSAAEKMPPDSTILLAFDNDEGGRALADRIDDLLSSVHPNIKAHLPEAAGDDWNDVLRHTQATDPASPTPN